MPTLPEAKPYTIPATPNPIPVYLLNSFLAEGKGLVRFAQGKAPLPLATPISARQAPCSVDPLRGFSSLRLGSTTILYTRNSILSYVKFSWRRGRDSNPRNLAVHLISNQTQSTTLPPLLTRTVEEAITAEAGKRKLPWWS